MQILGLDPNRGSGGWISGSLHCGTPVIDRPSGHSGTLTTLEINEIGSYTSTLLRVYQKNKKQKSQNTFARETKRKS